MSTSTTSQDLLFILGKLDGKLDGIQTNLAAISIRADGLETRMSHMEIDLAKLVSSRGSQADKLQEIEIKTNELMAWKSENTGMEKKTLRLQSAMQVMLGAAIPILIWIANNLLS